MMKQTGKIPARCSEAYLCAAQRRKAFYHAPFHSLGGFFAVLAITALSAFHTGCGRPEQPGSDDYGTLTPDERYIVELYMKINDLEKNLQDNPADSVKKWEELSSGIDRERVKRVLEELKKDPERWHAVFSRISELQERQSSQ